MKRLLKGIDFYFTTLHNFSHYSDSHRLSEKDIKAVKDYVSKL